MSESKNFKRKASELIQSSSDIELVEFLSKFLEIIDILQRKKLNQFDRYLPLGDLFVDRWDKANTLNFGEGTSVYDSAIIIGNVCIGKNTWIGPNVILDGSGGLTIGDNCSLSANVQVYSHDTVKWAVSGGEESYEYRATEIGSNCYFGPNTVISKGVKIGSGSIIGANSFVNINLDPGTKAAGNPVKIL